VYTLESLKNQYKKFQIAKKHFNLKASSWQSLCDKVNGEFAKDALIQELKDEVENLKGQIIKLSFKSELDLLLTDLVYKRGVGSDEIFESFEAIEGEPEGTGRDDWAYLESVLKRRYYRLSKLYHPDNKGSSEQMNNLANAYEIARTFVKNNGGMGK
jgi:hypothetical protein